MAAALGSHPEIFVPRFKEAYHFGFVDDAALGGARYEKFFSEWAGQSVVGEATPEYLFRPQSAEQISRYLPDVKAIVLLRNPVDRAYSAYWHGIRDGWIRGSFSRVVSAELSGTRSAGRAYRDLAERGQYAEQLQRFLDYGFDRDRMLVLMFEEVLADQQSALLEVEEFLGVEPVLTLFPKVNDARSTSLPRPVANAFARVWRNPMISRITSLTDRPFTPPEMDPEVRARLIEHFRPWNQRLSELLGRDLPDWNR